MDLHSKVHYQIVTNVHLNLDKNVKSNKTVAISNNTEEAIYNTLETTAYRKKTHNGVYLHWRSFAPPTWKRSTLR